MYCDSGSKVKKLINFFNNVQSKAFEPLMLEEGWVTSLVGGPYVGRRSPSQAGLLNGSSSISKNMRSIIPEIFRDDRPQRKLVSNNFWRVAVKWFWVKGQK